MKRLNGIELGRRERRWGESLRHQSGDGCTSGADLLAFVEGRLSEKDRNKVIGHLGHCSGCRDTVFQLRATEKMLQPKSPGWLGILSRNRFVLAGAASFVLVAAVVWTKLPSKNGHAPLQVAINDPRKSSPLLAIPSGTTTSRSTAAAKPEQPVKRSPGSSSVSSPGNLQHSKPERGHEKTLLPVPGRESSPSKTLVAINEGGSSFAGTRAMKMCVLVGPSHAFQIGETDTKSDQRAEIEKQYADQVVADQKFCDEAIASGDDSSQSMEKLKADLAEAARSRDSQIADLYNNPQDIRDAHPELQVEGDGPYQVVEVTYHAHPKEQVPVFEDYVVVTPWPGYASEDIPYGWQYGQHYRRDEFRGHYSAWHGRNTGTGKPVFHGLVGFNGPVSARSITRRSGGGIAFEPSGNAIARPKASQRLGYYHAPGDNANARSSPAASARMSASKFGSGYAGSAIGRSAHAAPLLGATGGKYSHSSGGPISKYSGSTRGGHSGQNGGAGQGYSSKYGSHEKPGSEGQPSSSSGNRYGTGARSGAKYSGSSVGHSSSFGEGKGSYGGGTSRKSYGSSGVGSSTGRPTGSRQSGQIGGRPSGGGSHSSAPRRGGH